MTFAPHQEWCLHQQAAASRQSPRDKVTRFVGTEGDGSSDVGLLPTASLKHIEMLGCYVSAQTQLWKALPEFTSDITS
ncbi:hypothetical protein N7489_007703 [Penicillium chrysogenum]|uniref:Uncharacterized protein n=1 Tax=Penicillium chrysogenum TaxID=5076 RepID=A0ABQ8WB95_PENCH|nr:uncharacterized protein N7489_007703 [Penicillium chrysogenum]KAJ5237612.1 hypothetical protein N7489_007703 [Penicillium chrysogenum]KAJ5262125.1 hypothetical protein N7505_008992 [Penicillium chrysogenum]KAJ5277912.1 hypothetical protein N7524_004065 [Penicillium chrysogenum]KAJ6160055.1 hypothetical protein N7497_004592 [Penicillium chrysogenum]